MDELYERELTDENIRAIFADADDFIVRRVRCDGRTLYAYAIDGLTSGADTSEYVLRPLAESLHGADMRALYDAALNGGVYNSVADPCEDLRTAAGKLVNGFCVILFPQVGAIAFEVKTGEKRGPSAPEVENTVKGPKDAFTETVRTNTSLVRRHLRTPFLRLSPTKVGQRSLTNVTVAWIAGLTDPALVEQMRTRLQSIDIDGLLSPSSVEEYVTGSRTTAFPLLRYTERADTFCAGLLEGRVGLLVDGLPLGYLAPAEFGYLMESPEDRGRDYISASCIRILRYASLLLSLLLPGVYIAMAVYHPQMIPLTLLRAIIDSKKSVPFPTAVEVLGLLAAFELLQESGVHLPQAIGQSVSIIGGIVVGTAAVDAGLISPVALISVSVAGVCGFVLPNRDLAQAIRVWRFLLAALGAKAGLYGVSLGVMLLVTHMSGLCCMGKPYLTPYREAGGSTVLRYRLKLQKLRPLRLRPLDKRNQK